MEYLLFIYFQSRVVLYLWDSSMTKKVEFIQSQEPASRWVLSLRGNHFLIGEENNWLILQLSLEKTLRGHLVQITQDGPSLHQNIAFSQTQTASSPKNCFITFSYTGQYLELGFFKGNTSFLKNSKRKLSATFQELNTARKIGILKNEREDKFH